MKLHTTPNRGAVEVLKLQQNKVPLFEQRNWYTQLQKQVVAARMQFK